MGDRYHLPDMKCKHCEKVQDDYVYYAPSCGVEDYECDGCGKTNQVVMQFN